MTTVVTKQPAEVLSYTFEFADAIGDTTVVLSSISALTVTTAALVSGSTDVTKSGEAIDGQSVNVYLSAGTNGEDYVLLCRVVDDDGNTYELDGILRVTDIAASALVVEDGTVVTGANSYATIAQANDYLRAHARASSWDTLDNATKAGRLIHATAYLDAHAYWRGTIVSDDQALGWPRSGAVDRHGRTLDDDAVPAAVRNAAIEIAADGAITTTRTRDKVAVTVGPISTTYAAGNIEQGIGRYAFALSLVADLLVRSPTNSVRVVRA